MSTINNIMLMMDSSLKFDKFLSDKNNYDAANELYNMKNYNNLFVQDPKISNRIKIASELAKKLYEINMKLGTFFGVDQNFVINVSYHTKYNGVQKSMLLFYDPQCPNCIKFSTQWNKLVNDNNIKYNYISVNCKDQKYGSICSNIKYFPSIIVMDENRANHYIGPMTYDDIQKFFL